MTTWQRIIGCERERELLDSVMNVLLDIEAGKDEEFPMKYSWLTDCISEFWDEGNIVEAGYTLDDLAGLSWRLKQLSTEQFEDMIETYRAV